MRAIAVVFVFASACHATDVLIPPPAEGDQTVILVIQENASDALRMFATTPRNASFDPALPSFSRTGDIELYSANYAATLDMLRLDSGEQILGEMPTEPTLPERAFESRVQGESQSPWMTIETDRLATFLQRLPWMICPLDSAPRYMRNVSLDLARGEDPLAGVPVGSDAALVFTDKHSYFVNRRPNDSIETIITSTRTGTTAASVSRPDGAVILVSEIGVIRLGDPETVKREAWFTPGNGQGRPATFASGSRALPLQVDASKDGEFELVALTGEGYVEFFIDNRWQAAPNVRVKYPDGRGIAWVGPFAAAVIGVDDDPAVVSFVAEPGLVGVEVPVPGQALRMIANIPELGLIVGGQGFVAIYRGTFWERIELYQAEGPLIRGHNLKGVIPHSNGFFAFIKTFFFSWGEGYGVCQEMDLQKLIISMMPFGDRYLLLVKDLVGETGTDLQVVERCNDEIACPLGPRE